MIRALAVLLCTGCTTIGHEKVEGWPKLTVVEHYVPHHVMRDRCAPWGTAPLACAVFDLRAGSCDLWFSTDFPPSPAVLRHERLHCSGHDHVGETHMRDFLAKYLTQKVVLVRSAPGAEVQP